MADSKKFTLITGCLIPSKFPFIEKSSRIVLESLGIQLVDIPGISCCPNQMAVQSTSKTLWQAIAARNLALAEKTGCNIVSLCNGCYDTLKTVNSQLKEDNELRKKVNALLAGFGLKFEGGIEVKHVVEVLHEDIGVGAIDRVVKYPLRKLRVAPFVGCHAKRPMDHMGFDDPYEPYFLTDILETMGAEIVNYPERNSCCGGGLSIGRKHDVVPASRRVLRSVLDNRGEAVVVNCPFCFTQFYRNEQEINEIYQDGLYLPIFYLTELLAIAMGFDPDEIGLKEHYENGVGGEERIIRRIRGDTPKDDVFDAEVTRAQLEICSKCLACADDCSTAMTTTEYHPEDLVNLVLEGKVDEAVDRSDIWYCMNCHECTQRCPQSFGMVKLIIRLKNLAIAKGKVPEVIEHRLTSIHESGFSFPVNEEGRGALGLPEVEGADVEEIRELVQRMSVKRTGKKCD